MPSRRHSKLYQLIEVFEPQTIVEIGTWNGKNAICMIHAAYKHNFNIEYIGYDLFDDATEETDKEEFNIKEHFSIHEVTDSIKSACAPRNIPHLTTTDLTIEITIDLTQGNTNETLKETVADFVFIDGGHSLETIANDYSKVKGSKIVVFDDYYHSAVDDYEHRYGSKTLVDELGGIVIKTHDSVNVDNKVVARNGLGIIFNAN